MGVFINDEPSPMHVIETYLRNTERFGPGGATRSATEIIEALQTAGWNFISSEGYGRFVTAEAALRRLESDDGSEDPVGRPVHRPGYLLYPALMQALITYIRAIDGAAKAVRDRRPGSLTIPYLGEIPVLYYGEQIGVITDEDGIGHSFRFTPPAEDDAMRRFEAFLDQHRPKDER